MDSSDQTTRRRSSETSLFTRLIGPNPEVHRRRPSSPHAGVRVAEGGDVGSAVAVEVADIEARLVVQSIVEWDLERARQVQALTSASQHEDLPVLPLADDQVVHAVAIPVGDGGSVAQQRMPVGRRR